jgi:hypothetical protein
MKTVTFVWRRWAPLFLAVACACGADEAEQCEERSGTYGLRYFEQSGNCGPIPDQVITIDAQPVAPEAPCTGMIRHSEDNCEVTVIDVTCPEPGIGAGVTSTMNGKAQWSEDGSSGDATVNLVVRDVDGVVLCQSSYAVEYERL